MPNFKIFNDNLELYVSMLKDIRAAKKYVYLETYIFGRDVIGDKFSDLLLQKVKQGVEARLIVDDVGSSVNSSYFRELEKTGAKIKFFRKIKISKKPINDNNHRDHRKLLVIDDSIVYLGSSNITNASISWRDLNIRLKGEIALLAKIAFLDNYKISNKPIFIKKHHTKILKHKNLKLIRDVPSPLFRRIRKQHIEMIRKAQKEILIENPYFVPDPKLSKEFSKAVKRGVEVTVILPQRSDVKVSDIVRNKYCENFHKKGIKIMFYRPHVLHSKLMVVDGDNFSLGSANFNYRSLLLDFEINLFGQDKAIALALQKHFKKTLAHCEPFNYEIWKKRGLAQRLLEAVLDKFRHSF